jgi:high-affinity iron transporter
MIPSYLLSLREGLEAALLIGIVLGALKKMNRSQLNLVVWSGTVSAVLVSLVTAFVLNAIGASFEGQAEEIFEGFAMLLAAGVLTWMIFWMQRQSRNLKTELELDVHRATLTNGKKALFILAFLVVVREGIELALFLTAAALTTTAQQTLLGALLGLATAILLGWLIFKTTVRLDLARFFKVTSVILILFAAGLVAYGVHEFNEAGLIPGVIERVWDINHILNEKSGVGLILKSLFGYNGNPSLTEVLAYLAYFAAITFGLRRNSTVQQPVVQEA